MKNNKKTKVAVTKITETIDVTSGQVFKSVKTDVYGKTKEPTFIKLYIDDIARLNDLPTGLSRILLEIVKSMSYNNVFAAYMPIKNVMCARLGITINYLNKAIDTFHKKGLFIRLGRGMYLVDPEIFAKGSWEDIQELRLVVKYSHDGTKTLSSNLPEEVRSRLNLD
jgi:hypothetical protein